MNAKPGCGGADPFTPRRVRIYRATPTDSQAGWSKRLGSLYVSGRTRHWLKLKNPAAPAVKREAEEDWGRERWR
jgi:hypothetical protein